MFFSLGWVQFGSAVAMALAVSLLLGNILAVRTAPKATTRNWGVATKPRGIWAVEDIGPSKRRSHTEPWHSRFDTIPIHAPGNSGLPRVATKDPDFPSHQRPLDFSDNQNKSTGQQQSAGVFPDPNPLIKRRVNRLQLDIRGSKGQGYTRAWGTDPFLVV
ncbi:hypothetical protein CMUS01_03456 [Colletotrichum musicola]|uniref:Uncharacterized protein n=1 Tax=Colletotrichum musicola TaxID=2175873 RepID=A0A8H6NSG3_9PEZI|nr:hypothetical protein CMUS01_03456 [Colletotrichum musicola]